MTEEFLQQVKQATETRSDQKIQENREAILHLAEEIRQLKEQKTSSTERQKPEKEKKIKELEDAVTQLTEDADERIGELQEGHQRLSKRLDDVAEVLENHRKELGELKNSEESTLEETEVTSPEEEQGGAVLESLIKFDNPLTGDPEKQKDVIEGLLKSYDEEFTVWEVIDALYTDISKEELDEDTKTEEYQRVYRYLRNLSEEDRIERGRRDHKRYHYYKDLEEPDNYQIQSSEKDESSGTDEGKKFSLKDVSGNQKQVLKALSDAEEWLTSSEIADRTRLTQQQVRNSYDLLHNNNLIDSNKNKGVKIKENVEIVDDEVEDLESGETVAECSICGSKFESMQGFGGHLSKVHTERMREVEGKPSHELNALGTGSESDENVEEELSEEEMEERFPKYFSGERTEPDEYTPNERMKLITFILDREDTPMNRQQLSKDMYNLSYRPGFGDKHYNVMMNPISKLLDKNIIREVSSTSDGKNYALTGSGQDVRLSSMEPEKKEVDGEPTDSDKTAEQILEDKGYGRNTLRTYNNVLTKLVYQDEVDEITYYDFEEYWGGNMSAMKAFRTLFESPTLLNQLREEVCPHKKFRWKAESTGQKPSNWVLKLEEKSSA